MLLIWGKLFGIDAIELLFYVEMLLFTGLIVTINVLLLFITVIKETTKNSVCLFICTFGLNAMNLVVPLLWRDWSKTMLQELTITFLPYQGIICVIMLLSIGAYGIIKRKFNPLLGVLCAVLILAGQLKIGLLGGMLAAIQILMWNIVVSREKPTSFEVGETKDISIMEEKQNVH